MKRKQEWVMPEWMKPYTGLINNTGGNDVADLMNGNADSFSNIVLFALEICVKAEVGLLESLHEKGFLK